MFSKRSAFVLSAILGIILMIQFPLVSSQVPGPFSCDLPFWSGWTNVASCIVNSANPTAECAAGTQSGCMLACKLACINWYLGQCSSTWQAEEAANCAAGCNAGFTEICSAYPSG